MVSKIYGSSEDPWPFEYLLSALQFFALSPVGINSYLPKMFPKTLFHGSLGDFYSISPLSTILMISSDCVRPGANWNEWINGQAEEDKEIELLFGALHEFIQEVIFSGDESDSHYRVMLTSDTADGWIVSMSKCRDLAKYLLTRIGWYEDDAMPIFSAATVLNEYSYGEYGDNLQNINGKVHQVGRQ